MKYFVQTDNFNLLHEAVESICEGIRFGSEFCEYNMPTTNQLEKAYDAVSDAGKEFVFVTPRLSNSGIERLRKQLSLLNEKGELGVVVNDLGAINIITRYENLHPRLGRQEIRLPARSPWADRLIEEGIFFKPSGKYMLMRGGFWTRRWYRNVLSNSNLNYASTISFLRSVGIRKVDIDWIPYLYPSFEFLIRHGLDISVHLHLVPVAFTRRCHMARFLEEKNPEKCSKPCLSRAFNIRNNPIGLNFYMNGNAVYRLTQPSGEDLRKMEKGNVDEAIFTMNPVTGINTKEKIDECILCTQS